MPSCPWFRWIVGLAASKRRKFLSNKLKYVLGLDFVTSPDQTRHERPLPPNALQARERAAAPGPADSVQGGQNASGRRREYG
jgi:hypothetical protein